MSAETLSGRVVQFSDDRGYGFISSDSLDEDIFVHAGQILDDVRHLDVGMAVTFRVLDGAKGKRAFDVRVVHERSAPVVDSRSDPDDVEIVPASTYHAEITDALIASCPEITATEILAVRKRLVAVALERGWVD